MAYTMPNNWNSSRKRISFAVEIPFWGFLEEAGGTSMDQAGLNFVESLKVPLDVFLEVLRESKELSRGKTLFSGQNFNLRGFPAP